MSKYCLFLIVIYYLTGGNNSMSRFFKFGKLHVTKGNGDKLLGSEKISTGTLDSSIVHPRDVMKKAIQYGSDRLILAHNHPSGPITK